MTEVSKTELHEIIFAISKLSTDIDELKKKRDFLLDKFKNIQLEKEKPKALFKLI